MEPVVPTKGTGVVTAVPSDSPGDYATAKGRAKKADYECWKVKKEWAVVEIIPIIWTPSYRELTAEFLVTKAKPKVREILWGKEEASIYREPEGSVILRSGDTRVVALYAQWYLDYGEGSWRGEVVKLVGSEFNPFHVDTKICFVANLAWLILWACGCSCGHGSKILWDPKFLVESLSDSNIYMAYYTFTRFRHTFIGGASIGPAVAMLKEAIYGISKTAAVAEVRVVVIEENGKWKRVDRGEVEANVPIMADSAEPANLKFELENL
ncbi:hypothetical protein HOY82DRAFT_634399, partial [Tuber indicum]